jgi:BirA family transcriptional regulator, biotin operon repressor / biotin---[acetyl-CoA-carboxylase] ligase
MIIGSNIISYDILPSTNTKASDLLKTEEVPEGTIVMATFQSAGRGRTGNYWESEKGKNLLISIILYPSMIEPENQFLISMTVTLGINDYLGRYISGCKIKWPNDIYVNNDKIAGILIENSIMDNSIMNSIAGIGLNINQQDFLSDAPNPVSLCLVTGKEHDLSSCLSELTGALDIRYHQLITGEYYELRRDYNSQLYRLEEWCNYQDSAGRFKGRILSVKDDGGVLIKHSDKTIREYSFKEVDFIL